MRKTMAVFQKTYKDIFKNKKSLIMFLMFPIMTLLFYNLIPNEQEFFSNIFLPMHLVVVPASMISGIIAEEKEKNTLKQLMMANVKPIQYFIGIGLFVFLISLLSSNLFLIVMKLTFIELIKFYIIVSLTILCSMVIGSVVGIISDNQMSANSLMIPFSIILGTLPIFSAFNADLQKVASILYTQLLANTMVSINKPIPVVNYLVIALNFIIYLVIFILVYRKKKLDN